jgi:hypothetical protein
MSAGVIRAVHALRNNRWAMGMAVAVAVFGLLGTVSALWTNPFFIRMTPAGALEIVLLGVLAALSGMYMAVRRPACGNYTAGSGGVLGFVGIACPTCNKLFLLLIGSEALLSYFEPVRVYVAMAGIAVLAYAVLRERRAAV